MAAEEVKRDLQVIKTFLDDLVTSTQHTTTEIEKLRTVLRSLAGGRFVSGGPNVIVAGLKDIVKNADLAAEEVIRLNAVIDEAFASRRVFDRFQSPERGVGRNLTPVGGRAGAPIGEFVQDKAVEKRLASLQELSNVLDRVTIDNLELTEAERILNEGTQEFTGTIEQQIQILNAQIQTINQTASSYEQLFASRQKAISKAHLPREAQQSTRGLTAPLGELANNPLWTQGIPGGQRAIENVRKELEKLGFSLDDISQVSVDGTRQITRYSGAMTDLGGKTTTVSLVTGKYGNVLRSTQKNFRNFASAIQRNVIEVIKWTVAIGLVYGTMQKFQELLTQAIQTQARLADVQVALGASVGNLNIIFGNAAIVAREMGTALTEVIEAYVLALRAAGRYSDETERVQKATQLLIDSMILAKLSGVEQSLALDTLVGALSQTGRELDQGVELLDKWVAVSKEANVSLGTLAESFAITSTAAENVGLDIDKLNGVIAAVAEVTTLSATEAGNAVRAFISGFQTAEAEKALSRYGIAVRDAKGEFLSFVQVMETVVERQQLGIITDRDVARISESIGGGARRGAQVNALIENYSRVLELSVISANASGDAQEALALKLDTVETAITNLSNAFTELSHALGEKGGFLDAMESGIEFLTGVVDGLKSLVEFLGPATKSLAAFGAAWLLLSGKGPLRGPIAALGQKIGLGGGQMQLPGFGGGIAGRLPQQLQGTLGNQGLMRGATGAGIGLMSAVAAGRTDLEEIGVSIAGGIAGTLIAGPVGGLIGSIIGQTFVDFIVTESATIRGAAKGLITGEFPTIIPKDEETKRGRDIAISNISEEIAELVDQVIAKGFGARAFAEPRLELAKPRIEEFLGTGELTEEGVQEAIRALLIEFIVGEMDLITATEIFGRDPIANIVTYLREIEPELEDSIKDWWDQIQDLVQNQIDEEIGLDLGDTAIGRTLAETQRRIAPDVRGAGEARLGRLREEAILGGGVSITEIRKLREELPELKNEVGVIYAALADTDEVVGGIDSIIQSADQLTLLLLEGGTEFRAEVSAMANEILTLKSESEDLEFGDRLLEIIVRLSELNPMLAEAVKLTQEGLIIRAVDLPTVIDVLPEFEAQLDEMIALAFERSNDLMDAVGLDETQRRAILATYEDFVFRSDDIFKLLGQKVPLDFLKEIIKERGLEAQADSSMKVITPDIPSERVGEIRQRIKMFEQILSTIPGFELDPETLGVVFSDFVTDTLHGDNLAIQLALRDLIKVNEDQLEGIFNIPEGMSAFIPFTAAMNLAGARGGIDYDFSQLEAAEQRSADDIVAEIATVRDAIMGGEISVPAGFTKIEELWGELQTMREGDGEGMTIKELFDAISSAAPRFGGVGGGEVGVQRLGRDDWEAISRVGPEIITVDTTNNIEIEIPISIRGEHVERIVRQFLERDLARTVSRHGGTGAHVGYK